MHIHAGGTGLAWSQRIPKRKLRAMDKTTIMIVLGLIVAGFYLYQRVKNRQSGKTISRSRDFAEYSETFTLKHITDEEFLNAIKAARPNYDAGAEMHGNAQIVTFKSPMFEAALKRTEQTDDKTVYIFEFTSWKSRYGSPVNAEEMNLLLTAVEKMLLSLDPNTKVSTKKEDITTKRHIL